ncbi:alpha-amylase family glycosyl hydrolase [Undibacterium sp. RTI2.1]|uniref:alpha-amylase family glycosyl hydrolase n=1 Tax=unclassified Undibacterium TaxID=2630295 RepID=UPI002AB52648|nr:MULTISPECIES: alpha-amylase family glycosyl hydrolase [unclassified Undibacterium]MDY7536996.1 alpha-amylase family glycosyl hydrolase [Undibacterium sp. 5I1]MEB0030467.1 alpha-amylase family glycosyl hydrolase [Undibacterium sp. RTI2.1]MEB0115250.1 alpha-amylase family glycosyl hydrolase [Undibacterium sp. RTI2.2]MEB0231323.1 alpha-amylase family glycosyl hydrolase [Undibacterium sp. 10I3]MEB0258736.1 alpha-amylase family glycosyl hydrolase [Undibacterium sp. 5I1]
MPSSLLHRSLASLLSELPSSQHALIRVRFEKRAPALIDTLQSLYADRLGSADQFSTWLIQLMNSVGQLAAQRSSALCQLDQSRSATPGWFASQDMLGYCTYVDRFAGDLAGVADKIPHLTEMGVRYLHLLPFLKARQGENDGGFAVADFDAIEPRLGSMQDLQALTTRLRDANISLCSDFILNHIADDHPWAMDAKQGDPHYQNYFYHYADRQKPDEFETTLGQVFPQVAPGNFSFIEEMQSWVWTTFYPYQWDLNYSNPSVFSDMAAALLRLANRGIEVFRLDSTAFLWKREQTNCMNQPEAHWILQALRSIVDIAAPGVLLKAEAIVPTAELPAYLGSADGVVKECHIAYHSSLMAASWVALAEQNTELIQQVILGTPVLPDQTSWLTYVRCHDDIGWNVLRPEASQCALDVQQRLSKVAQFFAGDGDSFGRGASFQASDPSAVHGSVGMASALAGYAAATTPEQSQTALRRLLLMHGLALSFGGMPVIYMGDELAQSNDDDYRQNPANAQDSRWLHRPVLDAAAFAARHDDQTDAGAMFAGLCHLLTLRRQLNQLAANQPRQLLPISQPEVLAFSRGSFSTDSDQFIFIGNFSDKKISLDWSTLLSNLPATIAHVVSWKNLLAVSGQQEIPVLIESHNRLELPLKPWSQVWLTPTTNTDAGVIS